MQELTIFDEFQNVKRKIKYPVPEGKEGISFFLSQNLKEKSVILQIGGMTSISLTIQVARDLALALRQKANFVEKHQ